MSETLRPDQRPQSAEPPILDQWLAASNASELAELEFTADRLTAIRRELAGELVSRLLWVSLGMLLLHVPAIYMSWAYGTPGSRWGVAVILVLTHVAIVVVAIRSSVADFESSPRAYSWARLGLVSLIPSVVLSLLAASAAPTQDRTILLPICLAVLTVLTYGAISPLLVLSWLQRSSRQLQFVTTAQRQPPKIDLSMFTRGPVRPPASPTAVKMSFDGPQRPSFMAQILGMMAGIFLFCALSAVVYSVTGIRIPFPFLDQRGRVRGAPLPPPTAPFVPGGPGSLPPGR